MDSQNKIEFGPEVDQALRGVGLWPLTCELDHYYLPSDTLLTGRQVSAAVKADPERLGARYKGMDEPGDGDIWTGSEWEYADGQEDRVHPDNFETHIQSWYLVYRQPQENPQTFATLAEYVAYAEHPDRLGQVSGVDADGDKVGLFLGVSGYTGFKSGTFATQFLGVRLPITAVKPLEKRQGKALRQWMVRHPGAKIRTEGGRLPVWWDGDECDYFNDDGPAALDDDVIGVPVSGSWND